MCDVCVRTDARHEAHRAHVTFLKPVPASNMSLKSFCNGCQCRPLTTPYFHCTVCADFDLCAPCEAMNDALFDAKQAWRMHDPLHVMIKYRAPHSASSSSEPPAAPPPSF